MPRTKLENQIMSRSFSLGMDFFEIFHYVIFHYFSFPFTSV